MVSIRKIEELMSKSIELPICPNCGCPSDLRGEFAPCCGEEVRCNKEGIFLVGGSPVRELVRAVPTKLVNLYNRCEKMQKKQSSSKEGGEKWLKVEK